MTDQEERIIQLLYKRISGEALTVTETADLDNWLSRSRHNQAVLDDAFDPQQLAAAMRQVYAFDKVRLWEKVIRHREVPNVRRPSVFKKALAYAAAIILLVSVATWLWLPKTTNKPVTTLQPNKVLPGIDKAILTLADGSTIVLDSNGNQVFEQGNASARQQKGQLIYTSLASDNKTISYNTLATPRGGQFKLTLPDGSRVWLNAASSLHYPTAFTGKERNVTLQGEAYFEVAKNAGQPFVVVANTMLVKALGTEFNINAYDDEDAIRATLLEGKVQIAAYAEASAAKSAILKPNEQALLTPDAKLTINDKADTDQVVAWKEGQFYFNNTPLPVILRQFARWYNVDVVYEGPVEQRKFYGIISRQASLSTVLRMLQKNDIHFRIEGNKLFVQAD